MAGPIGSTARQHLTGHYECPPRDPPGSVAGFCGRAISSPRGPPPLNSCVAETAGSARTSAALRPPGQPPATLWPAAR